jgi:hypothetical protein
MFCQGFHQNRVTVHIPSAETETEYIWRNIQDITFFEKHNYQVLLPSGTLIEELKQKSRSGSLDNKDYKRLEEFIRESIQ